MKNVCAETVAMGKVCDKPKHVLVVLNPAANKRNAEKMVNRNYIYGEFNFV